MGASEIAGRPGSGSDQNERRSPRFTRRNPPSFEALTISGATGLNLFLNS